MIQNNSLKSFNVFASESQGYYDEGYQDNAQYSVGHEPLQSLPATWYNSLMHDLTEQAQATKNMVDSIYAELVSVIAAGDITLSNAETDQLLRAIQKLTKLNIATGTVLGGVLSSALLKNVLVNADGTMTVNALNDWDEDIDGTVKEFVARAIEESSGGEARYQFMPDYSQTSDWITGLSSDTYTAAKNGFLFISISAYGVHTSTLDIYVNDSKVFSTVINSTDTDVVVCMPVMTTLQLTASDKVRFVSSSAALVYGDSGTISPSAIKVGLKFTPLKWVSDAPGIVATYAKYLVNSDNPSGTNYVTADASRNLTKVNTLTLG